MASASDAGTRRARRGEPARRAKSYCLRRCVRVSGTSANTFLGAPVRAGAFLFPELLLSRVIEARAVRGGLSKIQTPPRHRVRRRQPPTLRMVAPAPAGVVGESLHCGSE